ncbi:MAG: EscR/YscR/HrcR family type III secretion system export apparatus protein [Gammaproteobacteria bacterium]|nr:EscR/YscR/HrcR family type III secretion system export apparatus protein [Gammaproteobacteria bacterium]
MNNLPDPFVMVLLVALLGIMPFIVIMATSFIKLAVVLSLIRNALGVQQIPPNLVLYGLATILTFYIMAPVAVASFEVFQGIELRDASVAEIFGTLGHAAAPFREFLRTHASEAEIAFFMQTAGELWPVEMRDSISADNLLILVPAFTVSELTEAFQIGFLIYLPFIAIDLIISNILLAMGMMMVSPMTISLPFKLLLFVMLSGWERLVHSLVMTYQ